MFGCVVGQRSFLFSLTIHTEVQLSYAVLRLPRNKFKFLLKKKHEIFKKENTKLSTKHTKYLLNEVKCEALNKRFF